MGRLIDLTGRKFRRLMVIKRAGSDSCGQAMWRCKCDCGGEVIVRGTSLRSGPTKSCGCFKKEVAGDCVRLSPGLSSMHQVISLYKNSAKKRGHGYNLTDKQFAEITKQDCHYCNANPNNVSKTIYHSGEYIYNGLDRIDNTKGYTIDNVVPCCHTCNQAKSSLTLSEFKNWIKRVYSKMYNKKEEIK